MSSGCDKEVRSGSGVDVLDRAFSILFAFRSDDAPLTLTELSLRTGLYKSTLLRLATALIYHRFLDRLDDGRYRLGSASFTVGAVYQQSLNLGDVLLPLMRELNQATGEAVSFHIREGDHRVCLYRINSSHSIRTEVRQGDVQSLQKGAGGRVILAFSDEPGEIYDTVRRDLTYLSCGERDPDIAGVSAPVFGINQSLLGALGIVGPINRLNREALEKLRPLLLRTAAKATDMLGGRSEQLLAIAAGCEKDAR